MSYLEIKNLQKKYTKDGPLVVNNMNLSIEKGEFIVFLGPSGCGKTTTIRMISGLEDISGGEILIDGEDVIGKKPKDRGVSMIFQSYAIWPHMTVFDNIAYPLKLQKVPKAEIKKRVTAAAEATDIVGLLNRYPAQMSGGQRQRVGIARAIALEPEIIFCDESTSALDVSIQKAILELLVKLQKEKNIAIGFICHDLAMISSIAHQIAVMYMGNIVEILPGEEVARGALHPYTKALLQSVFDLHMDFNKPITPLEGEASMPTGELQGCPFQNRCAFCMEKCQKEKPELKTLDENHQIACWRI